MARARPTRLRMPPERSDGERLATSAPRPTPWRAFRPRCLVALLARHAAALDEAEGDILPNRQAVEQRGALKQHRELLEHRSRARPRRCVTSSPSTKICPASGRRIPSTHLIKTDLPVPEPPMTTSDLAFGEFQIERRRARPWAQSVANAAQLDFGMLSPRHRAVSS